MGEFREGERECENRPFQCLPNYITEASLPRCPQLLPSGVAGRGCAVFLVAESCAWRHQEFNHGFEEKGRKIFII